MSFIENIGTVALTYRYLLYVLLRSGRYTLLESLDVLVQLDLFDFV